MRRAHPREGGLSGRVVRRLVGVYDADGTVIGELTYFVGARLGRAHCALCDVTHGLVRERTTFAAWRAGLSVPLVTFHRDDQPDHVRAAHGDRPPAVVAETDEGPVLLLGPEELDACDGSVDALGAAIDRAVAAAGLDWPA